jgi:hypothetical protein
MGKRQLNPDWNAEKLFLDFATLCSKQNDNGALDSVRESGHKRANPSPRSPYP